MKTLCRAAGLWCLPSSLGQCELSGDFVTAEIIQMQNTLKLMNGCIVAFGVHCTVCFEVHSGNYSC